jgi:hypothetical protein
MAFAPLDIYSRTIVSSGFEKLFSCFSSMTHETITRKPGVFIPNYETIEIGDGPCCG